MLRKLSQGLFVGAMLMVVTYALLTPLALFTLDSASWETRGTARVQGISSACKPTCSRTA